MSRDKRVSRLLFALAFGLAITVVAYVAVRLLDLAISPEPNPAIVIWTDRSRFIWRVLIAAYLGGAAVFGAYGLTKRIPETHEAWLERAILVAGVALLLQAAFFP